MCQVNICTLTHIQLDTQTLTHTHSQCVRQMLSLALGAHHFVMLCLIRNVSQFHVAYEYSRICG